MSKSIREGEIPIIEGMYKQVTKMLKLDMDAFILNDEKLAKTIGDMDDFVDESFLKARDKVVEIIRDKNGDPEEALDLMQIVKYVERIGDHAENIAEWIIYSNTGVHPSLKRDNIEDLI